MSGDWGKETFFSFKDMADREQIIEDAWYIALRNNSHSLYPQMGFNAQLAVGPFSSLRFLGLKRWVLGLLLAAEEGLLTNVLTSGWKFWSVWGSFSMCKTHPFSFVDLDLAQNKEKCHFMWTRALLSIYLSVVEMDELNPDQSVVRKTGMHNSCNGEMLSPNPHHGELHPLVGLSARVCVRKPMPWVGFRTEVYFSRRFMWLEGLLVWKGKGLL